MKISFNWLNEIHPFNNSNAEEIGNIIDSKICKVLSVSKFGEVYDSIIASKIVIIEKHPNADSLTLVTVDTTKETIQVVCGAKNIEVGQIVPLITVGSKLPDGTKIKRSKIRGIESFGMLCSPSELNLNTNGDGILILKQGSSVGESIGKSLKISDTIYQLSDDARLESNFQLSHLDIRLKISEFLNESFNPSFDFSLSDFPKSNTTVKIEDTKLVPGYSHLILGNIKIDNSSYGIKLRLASVGIESVNNVIDLAHYVMEETGQPLRIYDRNKIEANKISINKPTQNFLFTIWHDLQLEIDQSILTIFDANNPISIAGILCGEKAMVRDNTNSLFVESASFNPDEIKNSISKLKIRSKSGMRFSQNIPISRRLYALKRFLELMKSEGINYTICGSGE